MLYTDVYIRIPASGSVILQMIEREGGVGRGAFRGSQSTRGGRGEISSVHSRPRVHLPLARALICGPVVNRLIPFRDKPFRRLLPSRSSFNFQLRVYARLSVCASGWCAGERGGRGGDPDGRT